MSMFTVRSVSACDKGTKIVTCVFFSEFNSSNLYSKSDTFSVIHYTMTKLTMTTV